MQVGTELYDLWKVILKLPGIYKDRFLNFCRVVQEYEEGSTPEAVIVKDLDAFDMVFQAFEYEKCTHRYCPHNGIQIVMLCLIQ